MRTITFTLDTNCIIDLDEERPAAGAIRQLVNLHSAGRCSVALVAVSASERQRGDRYIERYDEFVERVDALGLGSLLVIPGMGYWGISYWDQALWADETMATREKAIHECLFSKVPFALKDLERSADGTPTSEVYKQWRNAWCDRQMFWAHDHAGRDVFVTSDKNFRRLEGHPAFPEANVKRPDEALSFAIPR